MQGWHAKKYQKQGREDIKVKKSKETRLKNIKSVKRCRDVQALYIYLMLNIVTVRPKPKNNISFKCNHNTRT